MKRLFAALACLTLCAGMSVAQKGTADPGRYPLGYAGHTWTGEVTAFDNEQRTLTLTYTSGKKVQTFVAAIPDAPYERGRVASNFDVMEFPYQKDQNWQLFIYMGRGKGRTLVPYRETLEFRLNRVPSDLFLSDFSDLKGRRVTVYYTRRKRKVNGAQQKYNDVWRIRMLPTQE